MARPKRKPVEGIGPTPERAKQVTIDVVKSPESDGVVRRIRNPLTIDDWLEKGKLTRDEHTVAVKYANGYQKAFGCVIQICRYDPDPPVGRGDAYVQPTVADMRKLWQKIGIVHSRWLDGVIVFGETMQTLERIGTVRNGTGLDHFKAAIHAAADVWGMPV